MKYSIQFISQAGFAAAIVLGNSLSAEETAKKGSTMQERQDPSGQYSHNGDNTDPVNRQPIAVSEFIGMTIDTSENEKIGEIDEVFIDTDTGEVLAMVISTGGFLGVGKEQTLLSLEDLRFNSDRTLMRTDITKDQVQNAPRYKAGETDIRTAVHPIGTQQANGGSFKKRIEAGDTGSLAKKASNPQENPEKRAERTNRLESAPSMSRGLAVSGLIGMDVENREGETVGDVEEVFLDLKTREVAGVVISTGGFLGMGDRKTLFSIQELSFDSTNEKVLLDYNRKQIGEFPEYKKGDQSVFDDLSDRLDSLITRGNRSFSGEEEAYRSGVKNSRGSTLEGTSSFPNQSSMADVSPIRGQYQWNSRWHGSAGN